jgi:glutathione synthase
VTDDVLYVDGKEIFLVYFRQGYAPKYYPTEEEWRVRETIEKSLAIKCPSIDYQLSGCKKI